MSDSRYIIGIDLGTTNSCVAYVDTQDPKLAIQPFRIPQLIAPGYVEAKPTLPSFCYLRSSHEWIPEELSLPWKKQSQSIVGLFAREHGAKVPTQLVTSAKSWLCHDAANRRDPILPFEAADDSLKISPVEASARYLSHIKEAWNHFHPREEFEHQQVVLTVPASFDEVARMLTAEAAKQAGFGSITFLEEPQAAFYSWISQHEKEWEKKLKPGDTILVCDVGGGTTDFSLIEVKESEGKISFQRMAVGDHLLLGGDNMDAKVAHYLEQKLQKELNSAQWLQLCHEARKAKETLLDSSSPESHQVVLQGTGSSVVQGTLTAEASLKEVRHLLLDAFFKPHHWQEALQITKTGHSKKMGLPYEDDSSIIKHLAVFLKQHCSNKGPDYILFNGGALKPTIFQEAIVASINHWYPNHSIQVLSSYSLDLAVARGAAYYGKVRRGMGVRISGGTARSYYLALDVNQEHKALTLLPRGCDEGTLFEPNQTFYLTPNTPVIFQLYTSHVRLNDEQGTLIPVDLAEMHPLPPIQTVLRFGNKSTEKIPVHLQITLTEIGTLELWLKSQKTDHKWALEFQLRRVSGQDNMLSFLDQTRNDETFDSTYLLKAETAIRDLFLGSIKPEKIMETLEELLERPRAEWPPSILRRLWDALFKEAKSRKKSPSLETRWWNLVGFLLRPGYGYPLDDFRIKELWKIVLGELKSPKSTECQVQTWICFRRIAGGLNKGQQAQITSELLPSLLIKKNEKSDQYQYSERLRAVAALELMDQSLKIKLGHLLVQRIISGSAISADFWSLGRIGARHLIHGSAINVIPKEICTQWLEKLLTIEKSDSLLFTLKQLTRKTDHRELNIPQSIIDQITSTYPNLNNQNNDTLTPIEQEQIFGEKLPLGLSLETLGAPPPNPR